MFYILEKVWKFSKWKVKYKQSALHLPVISALFPFVTLFISQQFIWLFVPLLCELCESNTFLLFFFFLLHW